MKRSALPCCCRGLLGAILGAIFPQAAAAETWQQEQPVAAEVLDALRGGYVSTGGPAFTFGADIRTLINGATVLETSIAWSTSEGIMAAPAANAGGQLSGDDSVTTVVFSSTDGATSVSHRIGPDRLANIVLTSASDQIIRQETAVTLGLPAFAETQVGLRSSLHALRLTDEVQTAGRGALGN